MIKDRIAIAKMLYERYKHLEDVPNQLPQIKGALHSLKALSRMQTSLLTNPEAKPQK